MVKGDFEQYIVNKTPCLLEKLLFSVYITLSSYEINSGGEELELKLFLTFLHSHLLRWCFINTMRSNEIGKILNNRIHRLSRIFTARLFVRLWALPSLVRAMSRGRSFLP